MKLKKLIIPLLDWIEAWNEGNSLFLVLFRWACLAVPFVPRETQRRYSLLSFFR